MTATTLRHRSLKTSAIALGLAMALSAPAAAADLVIYNWDGYMAPDAMSAFKAATGVSGEVVVHATNEETRSPISPISILRRPSCRTMSATIFPCLTPGAPPASATARIW
jgi:hypothetical protein